MRARNLRTGLVVDVRGERGVTDILNGNLVINLHSRYGGEGYEIVNRLIESNRLRDIKLVLRTYVKNPVLFPKE